MTLWVTEHVSVCFIVNFFLGPFCVCMFSVCVCGFPPPNLPGRECILAVPTAFSVCVSVYESCCANHVLFDQVGVLLKWGLKQDQGLV